MRKIHHKDTKSTKERQREGFAHFLRGFSLFFLCALCVFVAKNTMKPIGLLAGWGRFPTLFADKARSLGQRIVCVGIRGEADPALAQKVDAFYWAGIARLGRMIRCFKREGVQRLV